MTKIDQHIESYNNEIESIVKDQKMTKSNKIRTLYALGTTRSQIAKLLEIRYQHVRNVLVTPLKKS